MRAYDRFVSRVHPVIAHPIKSDKNRDDSYDRWTRMTRTNRTGKGDDPIGCCQKRRGQRNNFVAAEMTPDKRKAYMHICSHVHFQLIRRSDAAGTEKRVTRISLHICVRPISLFVQVCMRA